MSNPQTDFSIRYDQAEIKYITQFLVSPSNEEVLLELSSGLLNDGSEQKTLPIQTRVALPWSAVERLNAVLNKVVAAKKQQTATASKTRPAPHTPSVPQATLPQMTR